MKVGDSLILSPEPYTRRAQWTKRKVSRVGKKYFYLEGMGNTPFYLDSLTEKSSYTPRRCYHNTTELRIELLSQQFATLLNTYAISQYGLKPTYEQCRGVAEALGILSHIEQKVQDKIGHLDEANTEDS